MRRRADRYLKASGRINNRSAWWSLLFGVGAIAIAVMQPIHSSGGAGFVASTVGLAAIGYGIQGLRLKRIGRATNSAAAIVGVVLGSVGTLAMAVYIAGFYLGTPHGSWTAKPGGELLQVEAAQPDADADGADAAAAQAQAASAASAQAAAAAEAANTASITAAASQSELDAMPVQRAMQMTAGTIAFTLRMYTGEGNPWPPALALTTDNHTVITPLGQVLARLPSGVELSYEVSADLMDYTLVLTAPETGEAVQYDTETGGVTNR